MFGGKNSIKCLSISENKCLDWGFQKQEFNLEVWDP